MDHIQIITQMTCRWDISLKMVHELLNSETPWTLDSSSGWHWMTWILESQFLKFSQNEMNHLKSVVGLDVGAAPELKVPSEFSYWEISLKSHFEMLP